MREIKFRAWDEQNKVLHQNVEFIRSGSKGNDWIIFKSDKQTLEDQNVLDNPYFQQQIKLMQFIGLKDKNGVEIYEGDILSYKTIVIGEYMIFVVRWDLKKARWAESINNSDHLTDGSFLYSDKNEIIGNIYQNHELLT